MKEPNTLPIYQIDTFTSELFSGNPAAVCPLEKWLPDSLLQNIAAENNLAETAFYVKEADRYVIRWFTPTVEVDLCGHATLASAFVLFNFYGFKEERIDFFSPRSGELQVKKQGDLLTLDFPADSYEKMPAGSALDHGFNFTPLEVYRGKTDYMFVFENEEQVQNIIPDFERILKIDARGVIVTAPGRDSDFVSRFFAPQSGINEDPVTGSSHTTLTPYWSEKLGKKELTAVQISARKGYLKCRALGKRVEISGQARAYLAGKIDV
jgi:PhzF family phenazine biosynthesis protein